MAKIYLDSMRCGETETVFGMDQCSFKVIVDDADEHTFRRDMKIGERWVIDRELEFERKVRFELWELDAAPPPALNPHDKLGVHEVSAETKGEQTHHFEYRGARYELKYRVD